MRLKLIGGAIGAGALAFRVAVQYPARFASRSVWSLLEPSRLLPS
jgi:hypothetical protein